MAIAGRHYTFSARVDEHGQLVCDRVVMTNGLPFMDPVDAVKALRAGVAQVRVDASGPGKVRLMQMWEDGDGE